MEKIQLHWEVTVRLSPGASIRHQDYTGGFLAKELLCLMALTAYILLIM